MAKLAAFVGHSFLDGDRTVIDEFLGFFNRVQGMGIGFSWVHAEAAEPKALSAKILQLIEGKNVFIGICTIKEKAIDPTKLRPTIFRRSYLAADAISFEAKASDWVIQEIGLAIGRNMDLIILLEDGLRLPGGLQGNVEYIPFLRAEPSKAFNKILEMLSALDPKRPLAGTAFIEENPAKETGHDTTVHASEREDEEPNADWKKENYDRALFAAIFYKDIAREKKLKETYFTSHEGQKPANQAAFEGQSIFLKLILGHGGELAELQSLHRIHTDNAEICGYLAEAYLQYEVFDTASKLFQDCAKLHSADNKKLIAYCQAGIAKAKSTSGKKDSEKWLLLTVKDLVGAIEGGELILLRALRRIAEVQKEDNKFLAYTERFLVLKPDDEEVRFSLGYKYSECEQEDLALFHYLLIPSERRGAHVWNNVGVAYSKLKLKSLAVESYRQSERIEGTLAMSNLAHAFIEAGFLPEAEEICSRATKIVNFDQQIGTAISSIRDTKEEQKKKKEEILDRTDEARLFMVDFAKACLIVTSLEATQTWASPNCNLVVSIQDGKLTAEGKYEVLEGGLRLAMLGPLSGTQKTKKMIDEYTGTITGLAVEFTKTTHEEGVQTSVLGQNYIYGMMVLDLKEKTIRTYEKGTNTRKFYAMKRIV